MIITLHVIFHKCDYKFLLPSLHQLEGYPTFIVFRQVMAPCLKSLEKIKILSMAKNTSLLRSIQGKTLSKSTQSRLMNIIASMWNK